MNNKNTTAPALPQKGDVTLEILNETILDSKNIVGADILTLNERQRKRREKVEAKLETKDGPKVQEAFNAAARKVSPMHADLIKRTLEDAKAIGDVLLELFKSVEKVKNLPVRKRWEIAGFGFSYATGLRYSRIARFWDAVLKDREIAALDGSGTEYTLKDADEAAKEVDPAFKKRQMKPKVANAPKPKAKPSQNVLVVLGDAAEIGRLASSVKGDALALYIEQAVDVAKATRFFDAIDAFKPANNGS
jgi:hypothetical protein